MAVRTGSRICLAPGARGGPTLTIMCLCVNVDNVRASARVRARRHHIQIDGF